MDHSKHTWKIWPDNPPRERRNLIDKQTLLDRLATNRPDRIQSVLDPTLTWYPAPSPTIEGTTIIVCPGGGYEFLSDEKEGTEIVEWLNTLGIHAALLRYRVPRRHSETYYLPPLQDAQRSIRLVRSQAKNHGLNPGKIGVMGFSAGGHVAINAGNQGARDSYAPLDEIDELDALPDFVVPIYPAYLGNEQTIEPLSKQVSVSPQTPPTFLVVTQDDALRDVNAALYYIELKRHHITAELHIYSQGGHGYGLRDTGRPVSTWHRRCEDWLRDQGWI